MNSLLFYFFLALGVSFICSLLESVLLTITPSYVSVVQKGNPKAGLLLDQLKSQINRPLAAILSLNTIANVVGAAGVGAKTLEVFGNEYLATASAILTLSILVLAEIVPKTLGAVYWKRLAIPAAYLIRVLIWLTYPLVLLSLGFSRLFKKRMGSQSISREEVIAMAEMGETEGTIEEKESEIIENLFNLRNVSAEEVMTPRSVVFAVEASMTVGEVVNRFSPIAYSRIPVYQENLDNVVGFIHRYDLVNAQAEDRFDIQVQELMEPIITVQQDRSVADILDDFVRNRQQIFMVTDEFGTVTGLITLEDAIETLLGVEIVDEHDSVVDLRKLAREKFRSRQQQRNQPTEEKLQDPGNDT
ncbi:MAG: HlyC/CorC family transporter [Candidatus Neomarinimicrobiota bacterium]|nr:MAG: HlyC/CorC family transporter [Candidatus Neomarinimicrobiota bacterium]